MANGKRKLLVALLFIVGLLLVTSASAADLPPKESIPETPLIRAFEPVIVLNEFLQIKAAISEECTLDCETKGFVIGTTGGHPMTSNDDNHPLLYWGDFDNYASTSFTTLKINKIDQQLDPVVLGKTWFYDGLTPIEGPRVEVENSVLFTKWSYQEIDVVERIRLVDNPQTGRKDRAKIEYTLMNNTELPVSAGIRIALDIDVDNLNNSDAPFFVPEYGEIRNEKEWGGETGVPIPNYWISYDPLNLKLIGRGELMEGEEMTSPDRFVIADFSDVMDIDPNSWDYVVNESNSIIDYAGVLIYFNPIEIPAGESRTVQTYYGLDQMYFTYLPLIMK